MSVDGVDAAAHLIIKHTGGYLDAAGGVAAANDEEICEKAVPS